MNFADRYPEIMARFDRFWRGGETDRPLLYLSAPKEHPDESVPPPPELTRLADRVQPEHLLASARYTLASTAYFAEGHPSFLPNLGPGVVHTAIGGEMDLDHPDTMWFFPFLSGVEDFPSLRFDPNGKWWTRLLHATEVLLDEVGDEMLIALTDLGGSGDIVAGAVGRQALLMDIVERPEAVKAAVEHCHALWEQVYEANYDLIHQKQDVMTTWWPFVSRGRSYIIECDISALISPHAFSSIFVAADLAPLFRHLEDASFHLDGVGTECHVPALLEQEGLRCIQWVPAPGTSALCHERMLREIQEAGVSISFSVDPEEVERACGIFDPRRLLLVVSCQSEQLARELVGSAVRWSE